MTMLRPAGMDVPRARKRGISRAALVAGATVLGAVLAIAAVASLARLGGGGVPVARATLVTAVVRRGTLVRSIAAAGTLVPQAVHVVAATQDGIVESVAVKPGSAVVPGSIIARMSNPELDAAEIGARSAVDVARARLRSARAQAEAAVLTRRSDYTTALAQAQVDRTNLQSLQGLHRSGFVSEQSYQIAQIKATEASSQARVAKAEIDVGESQAAADVATAQAQLAQAIAQLAAQQTEIAALTARAATGGIVQSVDVDPGARVAAGAELARVADVRTLKAVLQVPEGQVREITLGMPARIDTGNGVVTGHVTRIAPTAQDGAVAVDVAFARPLPAGARPALNVSGTIDLATLPNVLSVARPAGANDDTSVSLYRIDATSNRAHRVRVRLGRGSADRVEILAGLRAGDTVIVSDTSAYNGAATLLLH